MSATVLSGLKGEAGSPASIQGELAVRVVVAGIGVEEEGIEKNVVIDIAGVAVGVGLS